MKKDKILYGLGYLIFGLIVTLILTISAIIFFIIGDKGWMETCLILDGILGTLTILMCFTYSWIIIDEEKIVSRTIIKLINVITWDDIDHIELKYKAMISGGLYTSSCSGILHYVLFSRTKNQVDTDHLENKKNIPIRIVCCEKSKLLLNKYYKGSVPDYEGMQLNVSWDILMRNQDMYTNKQNYFDNSKHGQDNNDLTDK